MGFCGATLKFYGDSIFVSVNIFNGDVLQLSSQVEPQYFNYP